MYTRRLRDGEIRYKRRANIDDGRAIIPRELATSSHRSTTRRRAPRRPLLVLLSVVPTCPILGVVSDIYISRRKHTPGTFSSHPFLALSSPSLSLSIPASLSFSVSHLRSLSLSFSLSPTLFLSPDYLPSYLLQGEYLLRSLRVVLLSNRRGSRFSCAER